MIPAQSDGLRLPVRFVARYQFLAELCGVDYFAFEGENVFPAFGRFGAPYGHNEATLVPVTSAPIAQVLRVFDAWANRSK